MKARVGKENKLRALRAIRSHQAIAKEKRDDV